MIRIVADTSTLYSTAQAKDAGFDVSPLSVTINGQTYREFDGQPIAGDNIRTAKAEIEASLETIILAFDKLFDSLFAETAMDVATDISVLQTLLAQEGLTQDGLGKDTVKEQRIVDEATDSEQDDLPDIRLMF